ncbi:MAG TPA: shikimate kinase [Bacteroidia bacterium]|jgi:shikimate kinase|nr:shikimate kinase [Bacteroidia bacterium]
MVVFLIGMPACGKTSIGKRLAKKLQFTFLDLDHHLADKENKSVATIFSEKGESFFRELEAKYLKEISSTNTNTIISVGGGTPCFHNNLQFMLSAGTVFYLNTPAETLFLRLKEDTKRPMFLGLTTEEIKEKINSLLQQREIFYLQAHHITITSHKSDDAIVEEMSSIITAN